MEVNESASIVVTEGSQVSQARRAAVKCAEALGFDETAAGRVALVTTEVATNLFRHGGGGEIVLRAVPAAGASTAAVELLGLDRGPGLNIQKCLADGYSTGGSSGIGLGTVQRASETFDLYTQPKRGTALLSRVVASMSAREASARDSGSSAAIAAIAASAAARFEVAGVSVARLGELCCGDTWALTTTATGARLLVVDGLGHGHDAMVAARTAREAFDAAPASLPIVALVERLHQALRPTRGAAVAVAEVDVPHRLLRYCGVGNIVGLASTPGSAADRHLVSHNGTAGHEVRKFQEFTYPWAPDGLLIMHTDGVATHWRLQDYPGLHTHPAAVVAGVLYRDFKRGRDDATVVVLRQLDGRR